MTLTAAGTKNTFLTPIGDDIYWRCNHFFSFFRNTLIDSLVDNCPGATEHPLLNDPTQSLSQQLHDQAAESTGQFCANVATASTIVIFCLSLLLIASVSYALFTCFRSQEDKAALPSPRS